MSLFKVGSSGESVKQIQQALIGKGFDPGLIDGDFGPATEAAVIAFQKSEELAADGVVGLLTQKVLGIIPPETQESFQNENVTVGKVSKMFPLTPLGHIKDNLPFVLAAMKVAGLDDKQMILMALGTIRAETASFEPISEGKSRFNTSPHGHPFDLYDNRKDLGNRGRPDGDSFKGRGFVQLTGRDNYSKYGQKINKDLVNHPELANDSAIASQLLALFLKNSESKIRKYLAVHDLAGARKVVNGGSHGLDDFVNAYTIGNGLIE
jgi:putative chitinase